MSLNAAILLLVALVLFSFIPSIQSLNTNLYLNEVSKNHQLRQFYFPFYNQTLDLIDIVLKDQHRSTTETCANSLVQLRNGLIKFDEWAIKCMWCLFYLSSLSVKTNRQLIKSFSSSSANSLRS